MPTLASTGYVEYLNPPQGGTAFWISPVTISGGVFSVVGNYNISGEMYSFRHSNRTQRRAVQPMTSGNTNNRKVRDNRAITMEGLYKDSRVALTGASTLEYIAENYSTVMVTRDYGGDRRQGIYELVEWEGNMDGESNCMFSISLEQRGSLNGPSDALTVGGASLSPGGANP